MNRTLNSPTCFIIYSWEGEEHLAWIRKIASDLRKNGIDATIDQWDLHFGADVTTFMESSIRESDFVLIICTPTYAHRADNGIGGVGYEKNIVVGEITHGSAPSHKFIPIIRKGEPSNSLPSFIKVRKYVDLREDRNYNSNLNELMRHMHETPLFQKPELGPKPVYPPLNIKEIAKNSLNKAVLSQGDTLTIGYIASTTTSLEVAKPYLEKIIAPDLTKYAKSLGRDIQVQFLIDDAQGQVGTHLEKINGFHSMGVNLVIGGEWSSQAQASLSYVNFNNMLLVSTNSTHPLLSIANDRLFRMHPSDSTIPPALADVMWSYGIKSVIIFQRGDSWGDEIVSRFKPAWIEKGGIIIGEAIRYTVDSMDFTKHLDEANKFASIAIARNDGDPERVGILLLSFNELSLIAKQAKEYADFYRCPVFGSDGTARSQRGMNDAPNEVNHMRVFSTLAQFNVTAAFSSMKKRYEALTQQVYSIPSAYLYDAAWAIFQSVLLTGSTDASKIAVAFPIVCDSLFGISGPCKLDEYGDRVPPPFDILYFAPSSKKASMSYKGGIYIPDSKITIWDNNQLQQTIGYCPKGP